jgi:hypothetical protein
MCQELKRKLRELRDEIGDSPDRETIAAAGVIAALLAALEEGATVALLGHISTFATAQIARLRARLN